MQRLKGWEYILYELGLVCFPLSVICITAYLKSGVSSDSRWWWWWLTGSSLGTPPPTETDKPRKREIHFWDLICFRCWTILAIVIRWLLWVAEQAFICCASLGNFLLLPQASDSFSVASKGALSPRVPIRERGFGGLLLEDGEIDKACTTLRAASALQV